MRNNEKLGEFSLDLYYDDIRNAYVAKLHNGLFKYRPRHFRSGSLRTSLRMADEYLKTLCHES